MALTPVASDNFNRGDGDIGANWTNGPVGSGCSVNTNKLEPTDQNDDNPEFWNGDSFAAQAQYSDLTFDTLDGSANYMGPCVHMDASDYVASQCREGDPPDAIIFWYNGGSYTEIASQASVVWAGGDTGRLEVSGTTYTFYRNDVSLINGTNGSAPTSGAAGVTMYSAGERIEDWVGGDITADGPANLKTFNGVATASIKTIDGTAIASVKTINGVS